VLDAQSRALPNIFDLATTGARSHGVNAELQLKEARMMLLDLLSGPVADLSPSSVGVMLGRLALSCMQLQAALENILRAAEQLTETRLVELREIKDGRLVGQPDTSEAETTLRHMHELLRDGMGHLVLQLRQETSGDADEARGREIEMNRLEAKTRRDMLERLRDAHRLGESLPMLAISDAYETAGNQLFRMAEVVEQSEAAMRESADAGAPVLQA
jgi:hypothetical protein